MIGINHSNQTSLVTHMCLEPSHCLLVQIPLFYISGHITPTDVACKPSHSSFGLNSNKQFDGENTPNSKLYKTVHSRRTQVHSDKKGYVTLVKSPLYRQTSFNIPRLVLRKDKYKQTNFICII